MGCQRAGDGQGHSRAARRLPKDKASNIQGNATGSTKGRDGESNGAELSREEVPYRAFRTEQIVWD